jgi:hypothetical protein
MKLYYGGCGRHMTFAVAEDTKDAIKKIGEKLGISYMPVEADVIDDIDGYAIVPALPVIEAKDNPDGAELRHCKKCDFTCENQGELLAHYREAHPKGA